jgi:predicted small lipoprotein YifL
MLRLFIAALALATLAACGGVGGLYLVSHKLNWSKPGFNQQQLDADWYACTKQNTSNPSDGMSIPEENMAKQCMAAKGYSYTETGF